MIVLKNFQVPCTATSSERSSSYNSCTLPLKPLKGILKKKNNQQENSGNGPNHMREMSYSTMTLPRDILHQCHGQQLHQLEQHQLEQHHLHQQGPHAHHQHHGQFEVIFFSKMNSKIPKRVAKKIISSKKEIVFKILFKFAK